MRRLVPGLLLSFVLLTACGTQGATLTADTAPVTHSRDTAPLMPSSSAAEPPPADVDMAQSESARNELHPEAPLVTSHFGYTPAEQYLITKALTVLIAECVETMTGSRPALATSLDRSQLEAEAAFSRDMLVFDDPDRSATEGY